MDYSQHLRAFLGGLIVGVLALFLLLSIFIYSLIHSLPSYTFTNQASVEESDSPQTSSELKTI